MFLVIERIKGDKSFFKPFLDYLPESNETLFTIDVNTPVSPDQPEKTLLSELQNENDDVYRWITYERERINDSKQRFAEWTAESFPLLQEALQRMNVELAGPETLMNLFDWASLNVATRCFGHP